MSCPIVKAEDYIIDRKSIAQGAWGTVHRAVRKDSGAVVAMKFFGYTKQHPQRHAISHEVACMLQLAGVEGVAQLIGVFVDTKEGLVPGKTLKFRNEGYPVIVMDFLEGKDLLTMMTKRIKEKQVVNESFLATMFRSVMESLLSMHKKLYLHRDLKLDNMVFTSTTGDLKVKLVDCGYSCKAPTGSVYETSLYGTRGFFAPESLATSTGMREYSTKTDVWQAGCALYVMLSATFPFRQEDEFFARIISGSYYTMESNVWQDISRSAKELVAGMLQRDPNKRLSVEQVLNHPWLTDSTVLSNAPLGSEYVLRIQGLELRKKLKIGFQAGNIEQNHKSLKENFQEELPYLFDAALEDRDKNELEMEANAILTSADFKKNLTTLKRTVMEKIKAATSQDDLSEEVRNQVYLTAPTLERQRSSVYGDDIDYEKFKQLVTTCKLECLANEKIFSIFDVSGNGVVNMKQFLFALIALKPFDSTLGGGPDGDGAEFEQAAELYFQFFDMNEDGFIELPEFKMAFNCLFQDCDGFDESICMSAEEDKIVSVKAFDAVSVFNQIDTDSNGRIDISEFKKFYSEVFMATVSRKSIIAACNSFVGGVAGIDTSAAGQNSCESITGKKRDHTVVMGK